MNHDEGADSPRKEESSSQGETSQTHAPANPQIRGVVAQPHDFAFGALPVEIQLEIWRHVFSEPCIVSVGPDMSMRLAGGSNPAKGALTNSIAWDAFMRCSEPITLVPGDTPIRVNLECTIFYFDSNADWFVTGLCPILDAIRAEFALKNIKLRHVAFPVHQFYMPEVIDFVRGLMVDFPLLETVVVLVSPTHRGNHPWRQPLQSQVAVREMLAALNEKRPTRAEHENDPWLPEITQVYRFGGSDARRSLCHMSSDAKSIIKRVQNW